MRDSRPLLAFAVLAATLTITHLSGCANDIESPSPTLEGEAGATSKEEALAYPGFVCSAQEARWVEIKGENFAPVPVGTMKDGDPEINWPEVQLTRTANIDGSSVSGGISVRIQATGKLKRTVDEPTPDRDTGLTPDPLPDEPADTGTTDADGGDVGQGGDAAGADAGDAGSDAGTDADAGPADTGPADTGTPSPDTGRVDTGRADTGGPATDRDPKNVIWLDDTTLRFKVTPAMNLKPGMYDITVTAARVDGEGLQMANAKSDTAERAFGIFPPPVVDSVAGRKPVCLAQGKKQITLEGNYFLKRNDRKPTVRIGDRTFELDAISECTTPEGPFGPFEVCKQMKVTAPTGAFPASAPNIHVHNFPPADCRNRPERDDTTLQVVDPPVVSDIQPDPVCTAQNAYNGVTITGENFLAVREGSGATKPIVEIGDYSAKNVRLQDCSSEPGQFGCSTIKADIASGAFSGGSDLISTHRVAITNPPAVQCSAKQSTELTAIAPPRIDDVSPGALVGTQSSTAVVLEGRRFAVIDGNRPNVTVTAGETTETFDPTALEDCQSVEGPSQRRVDVCESLEFTLPADTFSIPDDQETRSLQLQVRNPKPLACQLPDDGTSQLTVVKPPTLSGVDTEPICTADQKTSVTVSGTNFITVGGTGPTVAVGMRSFRASGVADTCERVEQASTATIQSCSKIRFEIPAGELSAADHPVTVYNPDIIGGRTTTSDVALTAVDRPRVSRVEPELTCLAEGERTLTFHGQNFLRVDPMGMMAEPEIPSVSFDQTSAKVTGRNVPNPMDNCTELAVPGTSATYQTCEVLEVTVESDGFSGLSEATITNPTPADCANAETIDLELSPKPTISSAEVASQSACNEPGYRRILVGGSEFLRANGTLPEVTIGDTSYQPLEANDCNPVSAVDRGDLAYCSELVVFAKTDEVQGQQDVTVRNPSPSTCESGAKTFDVTANCP